MCSKVWRAAASLLQVTNPAFSQETIVKKLKGNIRQSVSYWCFGSFPLDEFTDACKEMGMVGIDLLVPDQWETVLRKDMRVTMALVPGVGIDSGFNSLKEHDNLVERFEAAIPQAAKAKVESLACCSGNRHGMSNEEGFENCLIVVKRILPLAEKHGVNIVMEVLNSKVDHGDYQGDHTEWMADLVRKVGSPNFKILYDIYHMQIMEGDLIRTIKKNADVIGHYHTGGNPGRAEIDETQEIYYPAVMKAILETGYKGYVAHEFIGGTSSPHCVKPLRFVIFREPYCPIDGSKYRKSLHGRFGIKCHFVKLTEEFTALAESFGGSFIFQRNEKFFLC